MDTTIRITDTCIKDTCIMDTCIMDTTIRITYTCSVDRCIMDTSAWVTRPERPKGAKEEVKQPRRTASFYSSVLIILPQLKLFAPDWNIAFLQLCHGGTATSWVFLCKMLIGGWWLIGVCHQQTRVGSRIKRRSRDCKYWPSCHRPTVPMRAAEGRGVGALGQIIILSWSGTKI